MNENLMPMTTTDLLNASPLRLRVHPILPAMMLLCLMSGCGSKDYELVPVSGHVSLDGKPVPNVGVMFVPLAKSTDNPNVGPGSLGRTDAQGHFKLETALGDQGAVPAEHVVRLSIAENPGGEADGEDVTPEGNTQRRPKRSAVNLPANARDGSLRFTVPPEGTDQADFNLQSR
jgi:hypothetical protein